MRHLFDKMYEHFRFGVSNFLRFIVSFVLFVVCYSIIYFPSWCQEEADREELKKEHLIAKGVVSDINSKYNEMTYFFVVNGKKYDGNSGYSEWSEKYGRIPIVGDSVSVCYKKDNPKVNMLLEYLNHEYVLIRKWVKVLYLKWAHN